MCNDDSPEHGCTRLGEGASALMQRGAGGGDIIEQVYASPGNRLLDDPQGAIEVLPSFLAPKNRLVLPRPCRDEQPCGSDVESLCENVQGDIPAGTMSLARGRRADEGHGFSGRERMPGGDDGSPQWTCESVCEMRAPRFLERVEHRREWPVIGEPRPRAQGGPARGFKLKATNRRDKPRLALHAQHSVGFTAASAIHGKDDGEGVESCLAKQEFFHGASFLQREPAVLDEECNDEQRLASCPGGGKAADVLTAGWRVLSLY